ncbi:MAG: UDP-N-acetylmuramoyl-L-alanine--D-glutamate ligase [Kiloniellales bacterium]
MIDVSYMHGLTVAVMGLGRSGLAAAKALIAGGAEVWAWDDAPECREAAAKEDIPLVDLANCDWTEPASLILSPGVPLHHPEPHPTVALADAAGVEVIGDIELLGRALPDAGYLGVTGTNGKSTTTALIGHVMEMAGREVQVGGNLGTPALALDPVGPGGSYVLEMSSFQLELTRSITFDVAVLLNISADHLDRYADMAGYLAAKRIIFHRQTMPRTAVVGIDDEHCAAIRRALAEVGDQMVIPISGKTRAHGGVFVRDGWLYDDTDGKETAVIDMGRVLSLVGWHNWQNAAAAYAAVKSVGITPPVAVAAINSYAGLSHRQELIAVVDGVLYVNDSKATNPDAAAKALACYDDIYWIVGGQAKQAGLAGLDAYYPRIAHAFLIGQSTERFAALLEGKVRLTRCGELERAMEKAHRLALRQQRPRPVVLLSPACASFDQFKDFEDRGDTFRRLVEALPGEHLDPLEFQGMQD